MKATIVLFSILTCLSALLSCSAHKHLLKAKKHIQKAISKDPTIVINEPDTLIIETFDTIRGIDGRDSLIYVTQRIEIPCPELDFSQVKTNSQYRQDKKTERVIVRQKEHTNRTQFRQENKKSWWWLWFLFGYGSGVLSLMFVVRLSKKINKPRSVPGINERYE